MARSVYLAHSGPPTASQLLWAQLLSAGPKAVIGGVAAAELDGYVLPRQLPRPPTDIVLPSGRSVEGVADGVRLRCSAHLGPDSIQVGKPPVRTRLPRSILDAAAWAGSLDRARTILVAGIQQRRVRPTDLRAVLLGLPRQKFRAMMLDVLDDAELGAHAAGELDFAGLCRRYGLPEPSRQVVRKDSRGRARWLDVFFDEYGLVVEIDGLWHMEASIWWADLARANQHEVAGEGLLRFPNFVVREREAEVAATVRAALIRRGWQGSAA